MRKRNDNKKKQLMMGVFIVVIMVGSVFGVIFYGFSGNQGKVTYNKISFSRSNEWWAAKINKKRLFFNYLPTEVEDIKVSQEIISRIKNTLEIDITYDINNSHAEEIAFLQYQLKDTLSNLNIFVRNGFTAENEFDAPIITCKGATDFMPVIYFKESNKTRIDIQDDCIIIDIKNGIDTVRVKDRLLYGIFDVLE